MRRLIRPALFLVARLGLFFSVLLGVIGVIRGGFIHSQYGSIEMHAGFNFRGLQFIWSDLARYSTPIPRPVFYEPVIVIDFPGVLVVDYGAYHTIIQYWLIVTIFALFNVLLMWIYRKRESPAATTPAVDD